MNEWANLLFFDFFTLGPAVLVTRRLKKTRYNFNKCFLYAAYLLILP